MSARKVPVCTLMNTSTRISMILLFCLGPALPLFANDNINLSAIFRTRAESKNDYNFDDSKQDYIVTQLRVNLDWKISDQFKVVIETQDSRIFGEDISDFPSVNDEAVPNPFTEELDLHRGFIELNGNNMLFRLGRQKLDKGSRRIVASLGWSNTMRVWDGGYLTVGDEDQKSLDIFITRLVPVRPDTFNDHARTGNRHWNSNFHGMYYTDKVTIPNTIWESYWLWRKESEVDDNVHTFGMRFGSKLEKWNFDNEIAAQFGEFGGEELRSMSLHLEAQYNPSQQSGTIALSYNYGSGDDDPNDGERNTFDNLYGLNHANYGHIDFFSLQNISHIEFNWKRKMFRNHSLRIALHDFKLAEAENDSWYNLGLAPVRNANGADVSSSVGQEIDISYSLPVVPNWLGLTIGYSRFFTGSYITDTGSVGNDANFYYVQSMTRWKKK